jgi:hypothetical protein
MAIRNWSVNASQNNASPPNGWPEGMAPSAVNDAARKMMADIRTWYEAPEWIDFGFTVAQASPTSFTVTGANATAQFHVGRRVRLVGSTTVFGTIATSVYTDPNTTITVTLDSGIVPADLSAAFYSSVAVQAIPMPQISWGGIIGTLSNQTDLQIALNGKLNNVTLTANRALVSDGSGLIGSTSVTTTTLNHLIGVTSPIQTQINGKANSSHTHAASDVISGAFATARLGSGTANSTTYLRGDGQWASLPAGTATAWGSITGTLSSQSDLQSALNGKEATLDANRKRQIFVQSGTPSGQATGDLWVW